MAVALQNRPAEPFETEVPMPDWQLTPEEELYGDTTVDANAMQPMVDENGMPIGAPPQEPGYPQQQPMVRPDGTGEPTQQELDQAFPPQQPQQRVPPQEQQPRPQRPPQRPQQDPLAPTPDPAQPRTFPT
jgi:penicillin-binding protein 1A